MNSCSESINKAQPESLSADCHVTDGEDSSRCWNCGCVKFEPLFQAHDFDTALDSFPVRRCQQCGLVYTGKVADDILVAAYSRSYYGLEKAKFLSVIETLVKIGHHRQAKKILDLYHDQQSGSNAAEQAISVLDIGWGRGV